MPSVGFKCCLCGSSRWKDQVFLHRIPTRPMHGMTSDRWLEFLELRPHSEWDSPMWKNIYLCSRHFDDSSYSNPDRAVYMVRVVLKTGSIPTKNPPCSMTRKNLVEFDAYRVIPGDGKPFESAHPNCGLITEDCLEEESIINNFCRICGSQESLSLILEESSEKNVGSISLVNLLEMYLSLQISASDPFLSFICPDCCLTLDKWHKLCTSFTAVEKMAKEIYGLKINKVDNPEGATDSGRNPDNNITSFTSHLHDSEVQNPEREIVIGNVRNKNDYVTSSDVDNLPQEDSIQDMPKGPSVFLCRFCKHPFLEEILFREHQNMCRWNPSLCEKCGKSIPNKKLLTRHKYIYHNENFIICEKCGKYVQCGKLSYHNQTHHSFTHNQPVYCDLCCMIFKSSSGLKPHMKKHARGVIKRSLDINLFFKKERSCFECPMCHQEFSDKLSIIKHLNRPYICKCPKCRLKFKNKKCLLIHKCRNWSCKFCLKNFNKRIKCSDHERLHTGERPYECRLCRATFRTTHARTVHCRSHRPPSHECKYCAKKLRSAASLKMHVNNHEGVFNVVCVVCNKRFSGRSSLYKHKKKCKSIN